ncbi:MAG TPA: hypothetical protein VL383_05405 [Gemmatimonadaceae bacterium]|jgi:hypothetical protein|nr:hypothetical protein [Gemmatimonadaceae bacterium]
MSDASMSDDPRDTHRSSMRRPLATPTEIAHQDPAYPSRDVARPSESFYADWRERLARNLSRRSDGRWEPLTYVHGAPQNSLEDR